LKAAFYQKAIDPFERCFWKAQIGILRACPPLLGVVSGVSLGADKSPRVWLKTLLQATARVPGAAFRHWRNKKDNRLVLPRITVVVTTRCTLRCDKCLAHIPDLKCNRDVPVGDLTEDIRSLLSCVDIIYDVNLSGGEAFLHPGLDEIIRTFADSGKVGNLNVTTNGTVIPDTAVLAALREAKANVKISRYPCTVQPGAGRLKCILKENGIPYTHESGIFWRDPDGLAFRRRMAGLGRIQEGPEKQRFSICYQQLGFPYCNGKLYLCCESALASEEGHITACEKDYVDFRAASPAASCEQIQKLLKSRVTSACAYCHGYTYKTPKVPVAVQRGVRD